MSGETIVTEALDGASVRLSLGERLVFSLPENPTTGFRWELEPLGAQPLRVVEDSFSPGGTQAGAGGMRTIALRPETPFQGSIRVRLKRGWEPLQPLRTISVNVSCE